MRGLHHVCLKANGKKEFDKAVEFYSSVFGLPLLRTWGEENTSGAMLQMDGIILEIVAGGEDSTPNSYWRHIAMHCDSPEEVDAEAARLAAMGYPTTKGPFSKNLGGSYPIHVAFCEGPLGEEIEFFYAEETRQ